MKLSPFLTPYREALWTNGVLLAVLVALLTSSVLVKSFYLLFLFSLAAGLGSVLELVLCVRALVTGHIRLALVYGTLCGAVAKVVLFVAEAAE